MNRRVLVSGAALSGVAAFGARAGAAAQGEGWSPGDGLRLAGPTQGLETLDPALSRDIATNFLVRQVCRGLMGYDEELLPVPELAASAEVSDDQTQYTFTLRDDARFQDGRAVEAQDVAWSLSRALHPATGTDAGMARSGTTFLQDIAGADQVMAGNDEELSGIDILDDRTLRITLTGPSTTFLMRLASVPASILDRHQDMSASDWWTGINGSGPYRVASVDPSTSLELSASDTWRDEAVPVRDVHVRLGLDASGPENLLQNGDLDLLDDAHPALVPLLRDPATRLSAYQVYETPQFALSYVAFGGNDEPLDDIHVRRAIRLAFDVRSWLDVSYDDQVLVPQGVIPQGVLGRAWRTDLPAANIDAARAEIAASRYGDVDSVPPIRIHAADIAPIEALRDVVGRDLGLRIEAVQVNWTDFLDGLTSQAWDAHSLYWGMDYPDPESLLGMLWESDSPDNYTGYQNDAYDAVLEASRVEPDDIVRQDLYMEAQQMLIDDVAVIPLYVPRRYTFARPGFSHVPVTSLGLLGLERVR